MTGPKLGASKLDQAQRRTMPITAYLTQGEFNVAATIAGNGQSGSDILRKAFGQFVQSHFPQYADKLRADIRQKA